MAWLGVKSRGGIFTKTLLLPSGVIKHGKLGNPLEMGLSIGKSPINAVFDYQREVLDSLYGNGSMFLRVRRLLSQDPPKLGTLEKMDPV